MTDKHILCQEMLKNGWMDKYDPPANKYVTLYDTTSMYTTEIHHLNIGKVYLWFVNMYTTCAYPDFNVQPYGSAAEEEYHRYVHDLALFIVKGNIITTDIIRINAATHV